MILNGILVHPWDLGLHVVRSSLVEIHRIVQTDSKKAWFPHTHSPTHALDSDLLDLACELKVFDFAIIMVVA